MSRRHSESGPVAVYPGSFNPPTVAHLAVSDAARTRRGVERVVWSISTTALAKETVEHPRFEHRITVLESVAAGFGWLEIDVTDKQLLVDVADGFDLLIMGADKWAQINEPHWYGGEAERDRAIAALPPVAVAPRPPHRAPPHLRLETEPHHHEVSSTRARSGDDHLMLPAARAFAERTGAWIDPDRYRDWVAKTRD